MLSSLTISPLIRCTTLVPVHILARGLENTLTAYQRCADCGFFRCADPRPTDRLAAFGALLSRPGKPGMYPFLNNRALELCKNAEHLKQRASGRGGCIDRLLFKIEVAPGGVEFAKKANEILQRSAKAVDRPRGGDVDLATHDLFQKPIELWPLIATFSTADAFVREFVGDDPSLPTTDRLSESLALVVDGLSIFRRNPEVQSDPFAHDTSYHNHPVLV